MTIPKTYCIGIAGGTGSGKTTLAQKLSELLGPGMVTVIEADSYYRDLAHLPPEERHLVNFDHPSALDVNLLSRHIQELCQGRAVHMNGYDFTTHCRAGAAVCLLPRPIILIEGILVLACAEITRLLDLKIYLDERSEVRKERRRLRDVRERGRTQEMFSRQYENHVLPMHERYVEPCKDNADIILRSSDDTERLLPLLRSILSRNTAAAELDHREMP